MTHLSDLKRLAELQKDATKGPWETGEASWNEDGEVRYTLHGNKYAKVADCQLIAQSGSTDFAALADYVEGLRAALTEIAYGDIFDLTMKEIAREALAATIAECGE